MNWIQTLKEISAELKQKAADSAWSKLGDQPKDSLDYDKSYNQFKKFSTEVSPDTKKEVDLVAKDIEKNINNKDIKIKGRITKSTTTKNDRYVYIYFDASGEKQGAVLELLVSNKGSKIVDGGNKLGTLPEDIKRRLLTLAKRVQKNELVENKVSEEIKEITKSQLKVGDKVKINHPENHTGKISSIEGDRVVVKGEKGENWNVDLKDLSLKESENDINEEPTSHNDNENKVYPSLWIALAGDGAWDKQKQVELKDISWKDAVSKAKKLAKEKKSQVRLSTSKGYNNQGYYFHHQSLNESLTWKRLTKFINEAVVDQITTELESKGLKGMKAKDVSRPDEDVIENEVDFVTLEYKYKDGLQTSVYFKNTPENQKIAKEISSKHDGDFNTFKQGKVVGVTHIIK